MVAGPGPRTVDDAYELARSSFDAGAWPDAIRAASQALIADPFHAGAFDLLVTARRNLELSGAPTGELRFLSVLMCDLVGSSRLTRQLGTETYRDLLLEVLKVCAMAVTAFEGRVAQYRGDGILAYFSYPQAHEDDPVRAVLAGLEIVTGVEHLAPAMRERFSVEPRVRVGVDTGTVLVGALGIGQWMTTDAIVGDPPNRASRIQGFARPNTVVISDTTHSLVRGYVEVRTGRPRTARSFDEPILLHRVLRPTGAAGRLQASTRRTPLVGRDAEVAQLSNAWAAVLAGQRRVVQIVGEAGIGKSRLAEQLVNLAHASGGRYIALHCSSLHRHVAFHPVAEAFSRLLGLDLSPLALTTELVVDRLHTVIGDDALVAAVAPAVAPLIGAPFDSEELPDQRRERILAAITRLVDAVADASPLLLVVDDAGDADPSTFELLGRLLEQVRHPFALIATSRSDVAALDGRAELLRLGPLDPASTIRLIQGIHGADDDAVERVAARAQGNPLFAEELARWLSDAGDDRDMPDSLEALLTARIDALDPAVRDLASTAAVLGVDVEYEELVAVSEAPRASVDAGLATLVEHQLLQVQTETLSHAYRFNHVLYRDAAYERQLSGVRAGRHLRAADVLERRSHAGYPVPPAVIARHYLEAGRRNQSLNWWERAAERAADTAAHPEAIEHFTRAIRLLDAVPDAADRDRRELRLQLGLGTSSSMVLGYTNQDVRDAFERANELAEAAPGGTELIGALMGLQAFAFVTGQVGRADDLAARAVEIAVAQGDDVLEATAYAALGYVRFFRGHLAEARALLERTELAVPLPGVPQEPRVASLVLLGIIDWLEGDIDGSIRTLAEAAAAADRLDGDRAAFTRAFMLTYQAGLAQMADDAAGAAMYAMQAVQLATEHRFVVWLAAGGLHLGAAWCAQGQADVGLSTLLPGIDGWRKAGAELMVPYFLARAAMAQLARGAGDEALVLVDEALASADRSDEHVYDAELHRIRAAALVATGRSVAEIDRELEDAARLARNGGYRVYELRALLDLAELHSTDQHALEVGRRLADCAGQWDGRGQPLEAARAAMLLARTAGGSPA